MYTIEYWNGHDMAWKSTGSGTFYDKAQAISKMKSLAEMCDYSVRFHITEVSVAP